MAWKVFQEIAYRLKMENKEINWEFADIFCEICRAIDSLEMAVQFLFNFFFFWKCVMNVSMMAMIFLIPRWLLSTHKTMRHHVALRPTIFMPALLRRRLKTKCKNTLRVGEKNVNDNFNIFLCWSKNVILFACAVFHTLFKAQLFVGSGVSIGCQMDENKKWQLCASLYHWCWIVTSLNRIRWMQIIATWLSRVACIQ